MLVGRDIPYQRASDAKLHAGKPERIKIRDCFLFFQRIKLDAGTLVYFNAVDVQMAFQRPQGHIHPIPRIPPAFIMPLVINLRFRPFPLVNDGMVLFIGEQDILPMDAGIPCGKAKFQCDSAAFVCQAVLSLQNPHTKGRYGRQNSWRQFFFGWDEKRKGSGCHHGIFVSGRIAVLVVFRRHFQPYFLADFLLCPCGHLIHDFRNCHKHPPFCHTTMFSRSVSADNPISSCQSSIIHSLPLMFRFSPAARLGGRSCVRA